MTYDYLTECEGACGGGRTSTGASTTGTLRPEMGIRIYLWPAMDMVVVSRAGTPTDS